MFRFAALSALVALLIVGVAGGAAAQGTPPLPRSAAGTYGDRHDGSAGLPPVTYDEIVGKPRESSGYSIEAIAIGAVAGVMAVNMVLPIFGYAAVPAVLAGAPVTGATLEAALATSRLVAVIGAAAGGVVGQWVYSGWGR